MASSQNAPEYPFAADGGSYEGNAWRTNVVAALLLKTGAAQMYSGILPGGGELAITPAGGMRIQVATGYCGIASSSGSTYGGYTTGLTQPATLGVAPSDSVNPRIDLVCFTVVDNGDPTDFAMVQVITGIPAFAPAAPQLPSNSLELGTINVPANSNSVTSGNINSPGVFTAAAGGIVSVPSITGQVPGGHHGLYTHDRSTGQLWHLPPSGPAQVRILPFAPAMKASTNNITYSGSETNIHNVTFTSPGGVDVKIFASWPGIELNSGGASVISVTMRLKIDGNQVATRYVRNPSNDGVGGGGGEMTHYTSSQTGDTPTANTHTVSWTMQQTFNGADITLIGATYAPILLRVEPVVL